MSDEILDYCNNRMPARIVRIAERAGEGGEPPTFEMHVEGLVDPDPTDLQWDAAHDIAQRFGLAPGDTRWQRTGTDARGRHTGAFIMQFRCDHAPN